MRIRAFFRPEMACVSMSIFTKKEGQLYVAGPIDMMPQGKHVSIPPCVEVECPKDFQELFDDLWIMGLRPSERSDEYKAQLKTMKDHLNDMRSLVFKDKRNDL